MSKEILVRKQVWVSMDKKVTVLGAGSWGTAIAQVLAENGTQVLLWCYESDVCLDITKRQENTRYAPGIKLHKNISTTTDLIQAIAANDIIFEAIPIEHLRSTLKRVKKTICSTQLWVILSKGIEFKQEDKSFLLPTQIVDDVCDCHVKRAVLSGPSFAHELLEKHFTATTLACDDKETYELLSGMLHNDYFKTFYSNDLIGVQLAGALKNVLALAVGIAQGNGYKTNTISYMLTKGIEELNIVMKHFNADCATIYSLAGLGDIILTCTGTLSKNLRAGRLLAQNRSLEDLKQHFYSLPEGINTIQSIHELIEKNGLSLPLCKATYAYIFKQAAVGELFKLD